MGEDAEAGLVELPDRDNCADQLGDTGDAAPEAAAVPIERRAGDLRFNSAPPPQVALNVDAVRWHQRNQRLTQASRRP